MSKIIITPIGGVDVDQTYAAVSTSTPEIPGLPFQVGTRVTGEDGSEYLFVLADATITQYQIVGANQDDWGASPLTKAIADSGAEPAVAHVAIASGSYGWVQTRGQQSVTLKNGCLPSVPLYTSASAGMLDDTSASQTRIYGIRATETSTASGAAKVCWIGNLTV